jgi:hypothetical protein
MNCASIQPIFKLMPANINHHPCHLLYLDILINMMFLIQPFY